MSAVKLADEQLHGTCLLRTSYETRDTSLQKKTTINTKSKKTFGNAGKRQNSTVNCLQSTPKCQTTYQLPPNMEAGVECWLS